MRRIGVDLKIFWETNPKLWFPMLSLKGWLRGMNIYLDEANVAGAAEWQQRSSYWVKSGSTKHGTGSTIRTESYMGKSGPLKIDR